jgi:ABC-type bacteriocin/lantibiotic exporter with double-glycine peptidase domain
MGARTCQKTAAAALLVLVACIIWRAARPASSGSASAPEARTMHLGCGPAALLVIVSARDPQAGIRLQELLEHERAGTGPVSSFHDLAAWARRVGIDATGVRVHPQALSWLPLPAIVHTSPEHFLALMAVSDDRVVVVDQGLVQREVPRPEFERLFTGYALCLSRPDEWAPAAQVEERDLSERDPVYEAP